ncbi:unnamed protein product [Closterium sp. NIES-54]
MIPFATSPVMTMAWSKLPMHLNPTSLDFASWALPSPSVVTNSSSNLPLSVRLCRDPMLRSGEQPWPPKLLHSRDAEPGSCREAAPLCRIDVSNAFLYEIGDAIIYVEQPHAFEEDSDAICLLHESLYGIKQAPRLWQQYLHTVLIELRFQQLPYDQGMYRLKSREKFILLVTYVDDLRHRRQCRDP